MPHPKCLFHCGRQKRDNTSAIKMLHQMSVWVVVVALRLVLNLGAFKIVRFCRGAVNIAAATAENRGVLDHVLPFLVFLGEKARKTTKEKNKENKDFLSLPNP